MEWVNGSLAGALLQGKHALPIVIALYGRGATSTSDLIQLVHGHPQAVIDTLRSLERLGILNRVQNPRGRHPMEARLTVRGLQLVETPLYRWNDLFRKWNRVSE